MPGPKTEPVTKQQFKIDAPKGKGIPDSTKPMRQTPPPIRQSRVAHAGREKLEETPLVMNPKGVTITGKLHESADIQVDVENLNPLEMEAEELRAWLRKAECLGKREDFDWARFVNGIYIVQPGKDGSGSARFVSIRTDDGEKWRLYSMNDSMASNEKFEKCRHPPNATLRAGGETYILYWETPELKQK